MFKRIFLFFFALAVALGAALFFMPAERIAGIVTRQIEAQTGRKVEVQGPIKASFYPTLGISTGPLKIANASWASAQPLLEAKSASIGVDAAALLSGTIKLQKITANSPSILLETAKDGRTNWSLEGQEDAPQSGENTTASEPLSIDVLSVQNASVRVLDAGKESLHLKAVDLDLRWPNPNGPADFKLVMRPAKTPVQMEGRLQAPKALMGGELSQLKLNLTTKGGTASFEGKASTSPQAQGAVSLDLKQASAFFAALGQNGIALPKEAGDSLRANSTLTYTADQKLSLRGTRLVLAGSEVQGDADISLSGKPTITANLSTGALDLSRFTAGSEGETAPAASEGWSSQPIDASALALFNGQIALTTGPLDLGMAKFDKTNTVMRLDRSRAVFELIQLQGYGGTLTGEFVINNRNGLSVGGKLKGNHLQLQPLLTEFAGVERLSGPLEANLKFLGVGQSVNAIMKSLSGDGALEVQQGVLHGIDLDRLMRAGGTGGGTTTFDKLTATFAMKEGVWRNSDLLVTMPGLRADGKGHVDLGQRSLDYLFTPTALDVRDGRGLAVPVRVKGSWANPRISADLGEAIDLNLKEEKEALKKKAQEAVREEVKKKLGVEIKEGQTAKEAIKEKARKEVRDGLQKELGVKAEEGDTPEDLLRKSLEKEAEKGLMKLLNRN